MGPSRTARGASSGEPSLRPGGRPTFDFAVGPHGVPGRIDEGVAVLGHHLIVTSCFGLALPHGIRQNNATASAIGWLATIRLHPAPCR